MRFEIELLEPHRVIVRLREGDVNTTVEGWRPELAAVDLLDALAAADHEGYAECYWLEPTGQYWWMMRREDQRLEVVVLWSRSAAVGWQHVFRAADEMTYLRESVRSEFARVGLTGERGGP